MNDYYNNILHNIENIFTSGEYDTSKLDKGNDEIITSEKLVITFTSTQNQKNNVNNINNMTNIELGECEQILKERYNISENETLYMRKIDIKQEGMRIPKVEYDIYYKNFDNKLIQMNKSFCEESKISLSIPVTISEDLEKLDTNSNFYNDICHKSTSDSGTDILLKDRQKEFVQNNKTICQDECAFSKYNLETKKANCSCKIVQTSSNFADMSINQNKLYEKFGNNRYKKSNLGITSCNVLTSKDNIKNNTGFFSLLFIFAVLIIIFILFYTKGYNNIILKFDNVIYKRFEKEKRNQMSINNLSKDKGKINLRKNNHNLKMKRGKGRASFKSINSKNVLHKRNIVKHNTSNLKNKKTINEMNNIFKPDTDYELNWLIYNLAIKYDKRTGVEYYISLIQSKQLIIFTLCSFNDYNSGIIKVYILFLSLALHYTINTLFFTESNLHQIYEDKGKFNFSYQLPQIIYSAIISTFTLRLMLQFLVKTDKDVVEVKQQKTKEIAIIKKKNKLKYIKIKFVIFFGLNFILLGLFWYYLTCFNDIYENT